MKKRLDFSSEGFGLKTVSHKAMSHLSGESAGEFVGQNEPRQSAKPRPSVSLGQRSIHEAVYVCYRDHVLFKNCVSKTVTSAVREAVGWIVRQDETAICLVCDRSFNKTLLERESVESGLVILRSDVLELRQIC